MSISDPSGLLAVRCLSCQSANDVEPGEPGFACGRCQKTHEFRTCGTCGDTSLVAAGRSAFRCAWCGATTRPPRSGDDTTLSSTVAFVTRMIERGIVGDELAVITGLEVIGGTGWSPPAGWRVVVALRPDRLAISAVASDVPPVEVLYADVVVFEFQGETTTNTAAGGSTSRHAWARIWGPRGETVLQRDGATAEELRRLFAPAIEAVARRHPSI